MIAARILWLMIKRGTKEFLWCVVVLSLHAWGVLSQPFHAGYSDLDSFVVLVAYEGAAVCTDNLGNRFTLQAGASVSLPADAVFGDRT